MRCPHLLKTAKRLLRGSTKIIFLDVKKTWIFSEYRISEKIILIENHFYCLFVNINFYIYENTFVNNYAHNDNY